MEEKLKELVACLEHLELRNKTLEEEYLNVNQNGVAELAASKPK